MTAPMLNHLAVSRQLVRRDFTEYAGALRDLDRMEDEYAPLSAPQLREVVRGAAAVFTLVAEALDRIDQERRAAWTCDGDLTRHQALDDALVEFEGAGAAIPPEHKWPLAFARDAWDACGDWEATR